MKRLGRLVFLGVALCGSAHAENTPPPSVSNDAVARAAEHYARGYAAAEREDYAAASAEFELAYQASPNYAVLYNLGHADAMLGRPVEAVAAFRRFLLEGGEAVAPELRERALAAIALNERRIGRLHVELSVTLSQPPEIDGQPVAQSALESEWSLPVGTHGLWINEAGYEPVHQSFEIHPGERLTLRPVLEQVASPVVQRSPSATKPAVRRELARPDGHAQLRTASYVLAGSGVALGVTAGVVYALNGRQYAHWQARRDQLASHWGQGDPVAQQAELSGVLSELSRRQRIDDVSVALGVGAGLCLGVAGFLFWKSSDREGHGSRLAITANGVNWSGQW